MKKIEDSKKIKFETSEFFKLRLYTTCIKIQLDEEGMTLQHKNSIFYVFAFRRSAHFFFLSSWKKYFFSKCCT